MPATETPPSERDPYDVNFCYPTRALEGDRVKLMPFVPSSHSELFVNLAAEHPSVYQHINVGPFSSIKDFNKKIIDHWVQPDPHIVLFAVYDLTLTPATPDVSTVPDTSQYPPPECFAGIFGLTRTEPQHLITELAWAIIFPPFQRSHITTHTIGMLLDYCLSLPSSCIPPLFRHAEGDGERGLGLRRVAWTTLSANEGSIRAAARMGFNHEGTRRWAMAFPPSYKDDSLSRKPREGDPKQDSPGKDIVLMAICWDDWENGGREHARAMMLR